MKERMTPRERVFAAFKGEAYDRMPLINPTSVINLDCMNFAKVYYPSAHYDSAHMATLAASGHDLLKYDTVMPYFSVCNEAAAFGCDIDWGARDTIPHVRSNILTSIDQYASPTNYFDRKYIRVVLNAIKVLKKKVGNEIAIVGKVVGPLSLAFYLYGIQNMMTSIVLEPEKVRDFVNRLNETVVAFALAQVEAGADIITISDDASGGLVTRDCYEYVAMEANGNLQRHLSGQAWTIYHMSGVVMDKIHLFAQGKFDGLNLDSRNDVPSIKAVIDPSTRLIGSVSSPVAMLNGTPDEIKKEVLYYIKSGIHLMAPECTTSCRVPKENHWILYETLKQYYRCF